MVTCESHPFGIIMAHASEKEKNLFSSNDDHPPPPTLSFNFSSALLCFLSFRCHVIYVRVRVAQPLKFVELLFVELRGISRHQFSFTFVFVLFFWFSKILILLISKSIFLLYFPFSSMVATLMLSFLVSKTNKTSSGIVSLISPQVIIALKFFYFIIIIQIHTQSSKCITKIFR